MDRQRLISFGQMPRLQRLASSRIFLFIFLVCWISFARIPLAHAASSPTGHTIVILASSNSQLYQGVIDTIISTATEIDKSDIFPGLEQILCATSFWTIKIIN